MKKNLYELLEVPRQASHDAIEAAYQRLSAQNDPDAPGNLGNPEAATRHALLRDAYSTLSNPARRALYDQSLEAREILLHAEVIAPFWNGKRILLALILLAATAGFVSWRQIEAERLKVEEDRIQAEQRTAELRAQQEAEQTQLEREKLSAAARQQAEFERARIEADMRQRQNDYVERQAQYQAQRQQEAEERKRQMEERERVQRARQEQYENERKLRQLEYERSTSKVVVLPK